MYKDRNKTLETYQIKKITFYDTQVWFEPSFGFEFLGQ